MSEFNKGYIQGLQESEEIIKRKNHLLKHYKENEQKLIEEFIKKLKHIYTFFNRLTLENTIEEYQKKLKGGE